MAWHDAVQKWFGIGAYLVQVQEVALVWVLGAEVLSISMPNLDCHSSVYLICLVQGVNSAQVSLQRACRYLQTSVFSSSSKDQA